MVVTSGNIVVNSVPLSLLGLAGTNGHVNFKVVISEKLDPGRGFTGVLDYASVS